VIVSKVKGKKIVVNESLFTSMKSLKSEVARIVVGEKCPFKGCNKMEFYHSFCRYSFEQYNQKKKEKNC